MLISLLLFTFLLSALCVLLIRKHLGGLLVDRPGERSSHLVATPRGGGLAVVSAFFLMTLLFPVLSGWSTGALGFFSSANFAAAALLLVALGTWDDWRSLGSGVRLLAHLALAGWVVAALAPHFASLSQFSLNPAVAYGAAVLLLVGMLNIYNFMDGLDGIVAGSVFFQLTFAYLLGAPAQTLILALALLGFLIWNWHPAKIFMGDGCSTFLGFFVGCLVIDPANSGLGLSVAALSLPLMLDGVYTIGRRIGRGENIFKAHRSHIYQRLHQCGWSHARVSACYSLATVCVGMLQLLLPPVGGPICGLVFSAATLALLELQISQGCSAK